MKVKIEITLDIDTAAWTQDYGVEGAAAIREDVKAKIRSDILSNESAMGHLIESYGDSR